MVSLPDEDTGFFHRVTGILHGNKLETHFCLFCMAT